MSDKERGYAHRVDIRAGTQQVWRALTEAEQLSRWCSPDAEISARKGGLFRASVDRVTELEAHIDVFDVNRRLRLIYLNSPNYPTSNSAVVDDFLLDVRKGEGTTSLRLLGSGIPESPAWDQTYLRIRMGWERFMARIKVTVESPPSRKKPPTEPKDPPLEGLDY